MKTKIHKIYSSIDETIPLKKFKRIIVNKINELYPNAVPKEKAAMYRAALEVRRKGNTTKNFHNVVKAENRINRNESIRANVDKLKKTMKLSRDSAIPVVFYLCSHHAKPAKDHEKWEKKLYVDRFWRSNLEGKVDDETLKTVGKYIKNHNIRTVQWVTGAPVYLVSRPFCKHYFVPVPLDEVLGSSLKEVIKKHPESIMRFRPLTDKERYQNYKKKKALADRAFNNRKTETI